MTAVHVPAAVAGAPAATEPVADTTWMRVADGLWAGSTRDAFLGTVELVDDAYLAVDGEGVTIDAFDDLGGAQRRVERAARRGDDIGSSRRGSRDRHEHRLAVATAWVAAISTIAALGLLIAGTFS